MLPTIYSRAQSSSSDLKGYLVRKKYKPQNTGNFSSESRNTNFNTSSFPIGIAKNRISKEVGTDHLFKMAIFYDM